VRLIALIIEGEDNMAGFDQVGKDTGPGDGGFLITNKETPTQIVFEYILFNYNIDGNVLKKEHKELLDRDIIPFVKEHRVHVKLMGMASQSGDREYNRKLSLGRVLRVKQYLLSEGLTEAQVPGPDIRAAGEDLSTSKLSEDPMDRAVRLTIAVGIKPRPLYPTIVVPMIITPMGQNRSSSPMSPLSETSRKSGGQSARFSERTRMSESGSASQEWGSELVSVRSSTVFCW